MDYGCGFGTPPETSIRAQIVPIARIIDDICVLFVVIKIVNFFFPFTFRLTIQTRLAFQIYQIRSVKVHDVEKMFNVHVVRGP